MTVHVDDHIVKGFCCDTFSFLAACTYQLNRSFCGLLTEDIEGMFLLVNYIMLTTRGEYSFNN